MMTRPFRFATGCAAATCLFAFALSATAQQLPAGVGGYWKVKKMYPKKPVPVSGCTANPGFFSSMAKDLRVLLSDRNIVWGTAFATDPQAHVSNVESAAFTERYGKAGATVHDLGLSSSKIEVIELGSPGSLPFDTIVVRDPSTLYFERCGLFMEAVHDSGFKAPPLPNSTMEPQ